jgi:hypothetical protein
MAGEWSLSRASRAGVMLARCESGTMQSTRNLLVGFADPGVTGDVPPRWRVLVGVSTGVGRVWLLSLTVGTTARLRASFAVERQAGGRPHAGQRRRRPPMPRPPTCLQ